MLKNMHFNTFSMDSKVSVYFSSVCLISERQQLRTSASACVWKHKRLCVHVFSRIKISEISFRRNGSNLPSPSSPKISHKVCVPVCDSYQHQRRWLLSPHQVFIYLSTRVVVFQSIHLSVQVILVFRGILAVGNRQEHTTRCSANESCIMTTAEDFVIVTVRFPKIIQMHNRR